MHRRPSCLEQGKHNRTDEKHDFICHTCIKGAQAELTAFRQKICAVLKHQSTRTHTHTRKHSRAHPRTHSPTHRCMHTLKRTYLNLQNAAAHSQEEKTEKSICFPLLIYFYQPIMTTHHTVGMMHFELRAGHWLWSDKNRPAASSRYE